MTHDAAPQEPGDENDLKEYILSKQPPIAPKVSPYYSKAGDFVSFCWEPADPFFTRRVDEYLTCYYSTRTNKVVGCKIKGIGFLLSQLRKVLKDQIHKPTIKGVSVVGRGLSAQPATRAAYEDVWQHGQEVEIEDPEMELV